MWPWIVIAVLFGFVGGVLMSAAGRGSRDLELSEARVAIDAVYTWWINAEATLRTFPGETLSRTWGHLFEVEHPQYALYDAELTLPGGGE